MNYLQYIDLVNPGSPLNSGTRFLVSGVDPVVRSTVGRHIVDSCRREGKTLFVVDNTQNTAPISDLGSYRVVNLLADGISLCSDLLEVNSPNAYRQLLAASRITAMLTALGFDSLKTLKVLNYVSFVGETEKRLGSTVPLTAERLFHYSSVSLVEDKLLSLCGEEEDREYLRTRYSEVSAAAADFEQFLQLLAPLVDGCNPPAQDMAVVIPLGVFSGNKPLQDMMLQLLLTYTRQHNGTAAVLVLDEGKEKQEFLMKLMTGLPNDTPLHLLSNDAFFSLGEEHLGALMNTFPVRIYSRHESPDSCEVISKACREIKVIYCTYATTVDKRLRANSGLDLLFGWNRTETKTSNAPVDENFFKKDYIRSLSSGTGIIDCAGYQTLYPF